MTRARIAAVLLLLALAACKIEAASRQDHPYRYMPEGPIGAMGGG